MTPCILVDMNWHFRGTCCLHYQDGGNTFIWSAGRVVTRPYCVTSPKTGISGHSRENFKSHLFHQVFSLNTNAAAFPESSSLTHSSHLTTSTSHRLDGPGFEYRPGHETFSSPKPSRPALGPIQPPIQWVSELFRGGKAVGAWYSAEVKAEWSCTSSPSVWLHGVDRDNFTIFTTHLTLGLPTFRLPPGSP